MIRLGLTGSMGMGKSTIAAMFADEHIPVWDADASVHRLYQESEPLKAELAKAFGDILNEDGAVCREKLSNALKSGKGSFEALNQIVHPYVVADREAFIEIQKASGKDLVVCDIPLLYETGAQSALDYVLVVSAPKEMQYQRLMLRPNMTTEKIDMILARQMPDSEKRKRADFIIETDTSLDVCRQKVKALKSHLYKMAQSTPKT